MALEQLDGEDVVVMRGSEPVVNAGEQFDSLVHFAGGD
jgi:hypothetical protein